MSGSGTAMQRDPFTDSPTLEGFEILSRIGRGPRSTVWRAKTSTGEEVALKVFADDLTRRAGFRTRFEKETSSVGTLSHPNVLDALTRGTQGATYYLAAPFMACGSLADAMHAKTTEPVRAVRIATGVCAALTYTHKRGLPHGHLTPENVFVDAEGRVKVGDFGLSMLEGARTVGGDGDVPADILALGRLLYELVSGQRPGSRFTPLAGKVEGVSSKLDEALAKALSPDPAMRMQRASELGLALLLVATEGRDAGEDAGKASASSHSVEGGLVMVTLRPGDAKAVEPTIREIERTLSSGGQYRIAYDLDALRVMDPGVEALLVNLHQRQRRNLERVAFSSPLALVRSRALVIGGGVEGLPFKVFGPVEAMRKWIGDGGAR
jgi:hypothetical protein